MINFRKKEYDKYIDKLKKLVNFEQNIDKFGLGVNNLKKDREKTSKINPYRDVYYSIDLGVGKNIKEIHQTLKIPIQTIKQFLDIAYFVQLIPDEKKEEVSKSGQDSLLKDLYMCINYKKMKFKDLGSLISKIINTLTKSGKLNKDILSKTLKLPPSLTQNVINHIMFVQQGRINPEFIQKVEEEFFTLELIYQKWQSEQYFLENLELFEVDPTTIAIYNCIKDRKEWTLEQISKKTGILIEKLSETYEIFENLLKLKSTSGNILDYINEFDNKNRDDEEAN